MTIKIIITQLKAVDLNTFVKKSVISLKANIGKCGDFGREEWYARRGSNPQPLASEDVTTVRPLILRLRFQPINTGINEGRVDIGDSRVVSWAISWATGF